MRKVDVRNSDNAVAYLADCTLATVSRLAMKKSRPVGEFNRQIGIAQSAVDWIVAFNIDCRGTRAHQVITECGGSVASWAQYYILG